jgi:hypothetical protein
MYWVPQAKAAESRKLVPVITFMLQNFFPKQSPREVLRLHCLESLNKMYSLMENWTPSSRVELPIVGRQHMALYAEVARPFARDTEWIRWRIYPKHHLAIHLLEDQVAVNDGPRTSWCYADEGEIGKATRIAEAVHVQTLSKSLLEKYRLW